MSNNCNYSTRSSTVQKMGNKSTAEIKQLLVDSVCVCATIPFSLDLRHVDAPAGVTQEEGHIGFLNLPSAVLALIFITRRIQPSLSLVDREVEFCAPTNESFSTWWACFVLFCFVFARKNPRSRDCTEIQTHIPTPKGFEATN